MGLVNLQARVHRHHMDHVAQGAETRKAMAACFQRAVRLVGDAAARAMWLEVLQDGKPPRPLEVTATDRPVTSPPPPGTTRNALKVWAVTGRPPVGSPPWKLDE